MRTDLTLDEWQAFVEGSPQATIFHHRHWLELLAGQYGFPVRIVGSRDNAGIVAAIPFLETRTMTGRKKLVSLPFTDFVELLDCPPAQVETIIAFLQQKVPVEYAHIEIRADLGGPDSRPAASYVAHSLELASDFDALCLHFRSSVRRNIRKARQHDVLVRKFADRQGLEIFYDLHVRTRKKHGVPVQPKSFFRRIKTHLFDNDHGFVLAAFKEDRPIGAAVFLCFNNILVYKFGASDEGYLSFRPNELIFFEAIKFAATSGFSRVDFGISAMDNIGLRRFKSAWGAVEKPVVYYRIDGNRRRPITKTGSNKALRFMIKRLPLAANRLLGELFYRFAG